MRRLALLAAVVVACAVPASAAAMTTSDAAALANAVNLQAADMPGYSLTPPDSSSGGDDSLSKCAGTVPQRQVIADISSANFETGGGPRYRDVSSDVQVLPTEALAHKNFTAIASKRGRKCLVKQMKGKPLPGVGRIATVTVKVIKSSVPGAFGYRITLHVRHGFGTIPLVLDAFGIQQGPVEASLAVVSGAKGMLPRAESNRLMGLLSTRLTAALAAAPAA